MRGLWSAYCLILAAAVVVVVAAVIVVAVVRASLMITSPQLIQSPLRLDLITMHKL